MSSFELRHPEGDLLLRFLDGELPRRKARQVRLHVEACWQCRAELDELQKSVAECVRYRGDLADAVPPPPTPWVDLSRDFARMDDAAASCSLFRRRTAFRWALLGAGAVSLVAATLALRVIDFRSGPKRAAPVETRPVPNKELPHQQASPASTITRADGLVPSVPGRAPARENTTPEPASVADELRAVTALHQLGADLGDPVEVARNGAYVVVGGSGVAPELQRQIREALASEPKVLLRFAEAAAAPPASPPRDATPVKPAVPAFPNPLEGQLGGRAQLERFSAQLLDQDETAMTRVYALRRLAEQFPPEAEHQLSPEDQLVLKDLGRQHVTALAQAVAAIDSLASPLLASPGASLQPGRAGSAPSWQAATQNLFLSARHLETLLPMWLGATAPDRDSASVNLPQQLSTALAQLQSDVQQCELLLKP
jgi:hypothetical protein